MVDPHDFSAPGHKRRRKTISKSEPMKAEYDFSKAERGKFYQPGAEFGLPVFLDRDVDEYLSILAKQKQIDVQDLVNEWLRVNMKLIESSR